MEVLAEYRAAKSCRPGQGDLFLLRRQREGGIMALLAEVRETEVRKKHEYWNHFIALWAVEDLGGGYGPTGRKVTGPRLRRAKELIWDDETFWDDILWRHNGYWSTPEQMANEDKALYEHCAGNFWGMLIQTMVAHDIL